MKLSKCYYRPFKFIGKWNEVTYKLKLPPSSKLYLVFHFSLLKKRVGDLNLIIEELATFDDDGRILLQPNHALEYWIIKKGRTRRKVWQVLV